MIFVPMILSDAVVLSARMLITGAVLGCSVGCSACKAIEDDPST